MRAESDPIAMAIIDGPSPVVHPPVVSGEVFPSEITAMGGGAYEAAERFSREMALWQPSGGSADQDIIYGGKELMDMRVRDAVRNDAYIDNGVEVNKNSVVGSHYLLNSKPAWELLKQYDKAMDEVWAEEFQQEVEQTYMLYAESLNCWSDAARGMRATEMARLGISMDMLAGEFLMVDQWLKDDAIAPFKTAMLAIDTDRLSTPFTSTTNPRIRGGVKKNARGAPLGYYIQDAHPRDWDGTMRSNNWTYMSRLSDWGRMQVLHVRDQMRPDQTRGISKLTAGLEESRIGKSFRRVMLQNAVVNATYAASIESELPTEVIAQAMGPAGAGVDGSLAKIENYTQGFLGALAKYMQGSKNTTLNGVRIPHFFPGTKLKMQPAGQGGPLGTEFEMSLNRYLAAFLGVSYEQLSKDFTHTNYSGFKGAINEAEKSMSARKRRVADAIATMTFANWLEEAIANGVISSMTRGAPNFWAGPLVREAYTQCEWIGATVGQIDELKETQAATLRIQGGISTREIELARLGKDWRKILPQLAREEKLARDLKLNFQVEADTTNMMNAAKGTPRSPDSTSTGSK